jgi:hypothetical protein
MYRGYGSFRFENTWADVSCFFTEGYGIGFLVVVVPLLSLTTFARDFLVWRRARAKNTPPEFHSDVSATRTLGSGRTAMSGYALASDCNYRTGWTNVVE